ncbi:MAG TPA: acetyl-CoA C-acetyltransferase [Vicinamibacteria bacterium]|jgi:acetyl-CoA C-acetyltransferase|nr:acetyl-CoA C-acetyltransferase [Vicinamibacteria bacterium]
MREALIVSAVRTPTGKFMGALKGFSAPQLGAMVVREAVARAAVDPQAVDEVILGNVVSAGLGQAPARQAAIHAGLPPKVAALTINKVCGSGLKAVMLAAQAVGTGDADVVVAGGMESMSNAPYLLPKMREGLRLGHGAVVDSMVHDGLWDAYDDQHMGCCGEIVAEKHGVSRREQDEYAVESHRRATFAIKAGKFKDEILPVPVPQKKGDPVMFAVDEAPREDTTLEALARLKPAFKEGGTVTAGNAPGVNDGAAALLVAAAETVRVHGLKPMARIIGQAVSGLEPSMVMMTPVPAVRKLWEKTGWSARDVDLVELNEAFAVQAVAVMRELGLDPARVNVHGGAVALGHPIGASGARVLTTLLYALRDRGGRRGVATLCLGGGNGVALAVELV